MAEVYTPGNTAKQRLVDASFDGKNAAYRGFTGKLHMVLDWISIGKDQEMEIPEEVQVGLRQEGDVPVWSLEQVQKYKDPERKAEEWDELESSALNALSDDIEVSIRGRDACITVYKPFPPVFPS